MKVLGSEKQIAFTVIALKEDPFHLAEKDVRKAKKGI